MYPARPRRHICHARSAVGGSDTSDPYICGRNILNINQNRIRLARAEYTVEPAVRKKAVLKMAADVHFQLKFCNFAEK
jgi:hypothetical protein